jgi:hypothetical protein
MPGPSPRTSHGNASDVHAKTTYYDRRAIAGDGKSLAWLGDRLSPVLRVQAEYRRGPAGA